MFVVTRLPITCYLGRPPERYKPLYTHAIYIPDAMHSNSLAQVDRRTDTTWWESHAPIPMLQLVPKEYPQKHNKTCSDVCFMLSLPEILWIAL